MSMFDKAMGRETTEEATVDTATPIETVDTIESTEEENEAPAEVDIVKLASAVKSTTKKVKDWEDKISDAEIEVEDAQKALFDSSDLTLEAAEELVKGWRNAQNKVERLQKNLVTYREMQADAQAKLKAQM